MRVFISVLLLISSVDAVDLIDSGSAPRDVSPLLIHVARALGCASGCIYEPQNVPQLAACYISTHLGANITKLFRCLAALDSEGEPVDSNGCALVKDTKDTTTAICEWITLSNYLGFGAGICLPKIMSAHKVQYMSILSAFQPVLYQQGPPALQELMVSLVKSNEGKGPCETAGGLICEIPASNYPMTPALTKLCIPRVWRLCQYLQTPPPTKFCPGKDPTYQTFAAEVAKLRCYKDECPKTECIKICPQTCPAGSATTPSAESDTTPSTTPAPTNTTVPNTGYTADSSVMLMSCIISLYILM